MRYVSGQLLLFSIVASHSFTVVILLNKVLQAAGFSMMQLFQSFKLWKRSLKFELRLESGQIIYPFEKMQLALISQAVVELHFFVACNCE
jgi:hypothetical protein